MSKIDPRKLAEPPGHTLHRLVKMHMEQTGEADYTAALRVVCARPENLSLVVEYQHWGETLAGRRPRTGYDR